MLTGHLPDSYGLPPEQRLIRHQQGARAEKAVALGMNLPWTPVVSDYREIGGNDVGTLGVRSTDRRHGCLILHPKDEDDRVFVLVLVETTPDFIIYGWVRGDEGKDQRYWRTDVRHPAYFVPQHALHWTPIL